MSEILTLDWILGVYIMALGGVLMGMSLGVVMILGIALLDGLADWLLCRRKKNHQ